VNTIEPVALGLAGLTALLLIVSTLLLRRSYIQDKKLRTLEYVTTQFDELERLGSRGILRKAGDQSILDYLRSVPSADEYDVEQKLLQYLYAFNRIGSGIYRKYLSEDVVFEVWTPQYFIRNWERWETFIKEKQLPIGTTHDSFRWLAQAKCPKVSEKYPKCSRKTKKDRLHSVLLRLQSRLCRNRGI